MTPEDRTREERMRIGRMLRGDAPQLSHTAGGPAPVEQHDVDDLALEALARGTTPVRVRR